MRTFRVLAKAQGDLAQVRAWYDLERPGLGVRFLEDADACFAAIRANPARFGRGFRDYREGMLNSFPYIVYYTVSRARIAIHRVVHSARDQDAVLRELN